MGVMLVTLVMGGHAGSTGNGGHTGSTGNGGHAGSTYW